MFIGTYDVLIFKNYDEWTYCMPVRNNETEKHINVEEEFYRSAVCSLSPRHIFFALPVYYLTDQSIHGLLEVFLELIYLFGQLKSCQCEF